MLTISQRGLWVWLMLLYTDFVFKNQKEGEMVYSLPFMGCFVVSELVLGQRLVFGSAARFEGALVCFLGS